MTIYQNLIAGSGFLQGPTGATGPAANTTITTYQFVATAGQSVFSGSDANSNSLTYTVNGIVVTLNGVVLKNTNEYTATNGTSIALVSAASTGDELNIYTFPAYNVANALTPAQANTIFLDRTTANLIYFLQSGGTLTGNVSFANGANLLVPVGNTAQRPAASPGYIRYNTDLNTLESANATAWANVGSGSASSSGGGGVSWQPIQNTNFISVKNNGYLVNTSTGNVTITLPAAPTLGDIVTIVDYAGVASANAFILYAAGNKIQGNTLNVNVQSSGSALGLVYTDSTRGWIPYSGFSTSPIGNYSVSYLIAAGGGGGCTQHGGGGGAGGLLTGTVTLIPGTTYTVTVGAGGAGVPSASAQGQVGTQGASSSLTGLTTAIGGGGGAGYNAGGGVSGGSGGSGGGGGTSESSAGAGGSGTSGQGNAGGQGQGNANPYKGGGGGGAGSVGGNGTGSPLVAGVGGDGLASSITGTSTYYSGGGGGGSYGGASQTGAGGLGGGGTGGWQTTINPTAGTTNTGGGGGGAGSSAVTGGSGGSGIVIIRYLGPQRASGGTITSSGGYTIHTFTSSATFVG